MGYPDAERMKDRFGEPDHFSLVLKTLGESAELSETHDQPEPIVDRCWGGSSVHQPQFRR